MDHYHNTNFPAIKMELIDLNLPIIYPATGQLSDRTYNDLIDVLYDSAIPIISDAQDNNMDINSKLNAIRFATENADLAVVFNKKKQINYVNAEKRMCNRLTYGKQLVEKLEPILLDTILASYSECSIKPVDIRFDPTHCDLLYYNKGGFFEKHRDTVYAMPSEMNNPLEKKDWRFYSIIVSIDSNIDTYKCDDGSTTVYLPPRDILLDGINNKSPCDVPRVDMNLHVFPQSCRNAQFVIFSAESVHQSIKIETDDYYKLVLKMDIWIKQPHSSEILAISNKLSDNTLECNCNACMQTRMDLNDYEYNDDRYDNRSNDQYDERYYYDDQYDDRSNNQYDDREQYSDPNDECNGYQYD